MNKQTNRYFSAIMLFALVALIGISTPATASVMYGYNQTLLNNPTQPTNPGWINGTGPADGAFTTVFADYGGNPAETYYGFVRFSVYTVGPITPTVENQYDPAAGANLSLDYGVSLAGGLTLSDFTFSLTINDTTKGKSLTYNPVGGDDTYMVGGQKVVGPIANPGSATSFEQSERLSFNFIASIIQYTVGDSILATLNGVPINLNMADPTVQAIANGANQGGSVPEPASLAMMASGLIGLGFVARKRSLQK